MTHLDQLQRDGFAVIPDVIDMSAVDRLRVFYAYTYGSIGNVNLASLDDADGASFLGSLSARVDLSSLGIGRWEDQGALMQDRRPLDDLEMSGGGWDRWHDDGHRSRPRIIALIALDDFLPGNATQFWRGSHNHERASRNRDARETPPPPPSDIAAGVVGVGGVVLFWAHTMHRRPLTAHDGVLRRALRLEAVPRREPAVT